MSKVEELLKDNKLAEKLSMAKLNDLLKKEEEDKKPSKAVIIFAIIGVLVAGQQRHMVSTDFSHRII